MLIPNFTPGRFTALWVVLRSAADLGGVVDRQELLSFSRRNGLRCGGLPIKDGFQLAVLGGFLNDGEEVGISDLGRVALERSDEEEPSPDVLRLFTSVLFLRYPPAWIAYWQGDPSCLDLIMPGPARDLLEDADLLMDQPSEEIEAWALWDAFREVPLLDHSSERRKAVGDAAEDLSFEYEKRRLATEGFPHLIRNVRLVARESPAYGFDILSFRGNLMGKGDPEDRLAIEVKGKTLASANRISFFLTDHEWRTSQKLSGQYIFHFWDNVQPRKDYIDLLREPIVFIPHQLAEHVPRSPDCNSNCGWKTTYITFSRP